MNTFFDKVIAEPFRSLFHRVVEFLPNLLSAIIVFGVGLIVAWAVKAVLQKAMELLNIDNLCKRTGLTDLIQKGGLRDSPSNIICKGAYSLVLLIFIIMSLYSLKIDAIENLIERFFLYLPNLIVAIVLIIIGYILSNFIGRAVLITSVNRGIKHSGLLYNGIRIAIMLLTVTMALEQLGIGKDTVVIAFTILFGGIVFALSLAFGLAGKDMARDFLEKSLQRMEKKVEPEDDLKHL